MRAVINSKQLLAVMAAVMLAAVVTPVALAGAAGGAKTAPVARAVKQLKKQIATLQQQANALQQQVSTLQGQSNTPRTPNGPAGGDLAGAFPNPVIGPNAVGAAQIQKDAVTAEEIKSASVGSDDVADNSVASVDIQDDGVEAGDIRQDSVGAEEIFLNGVGSSEISSGAVGALELDGFTTAVSPNGTAIGAGQSGTAEVTCPGETKLIAGGFAWADTEPNSIIYSAPSASVPSKTWTVQGYVPTGSNVLYAWASCLAV